MWRIQDILILPERALLYQRATRGIMRYMKRGRFIVFEGGDGSGKDTQVALLREHTGEEGFLYVRDPGSTEIGEQLRKIVLHNKQVSRTAELLLYLTMRAQLAEEKIKPALEAGMTVVSNRFDLSTIAYQIYGRERLELLTFVKQLSEYALAGVRPDVIVFLDCPPETALCRVAEAKEMDRFEEEKLAFHERVRAGYHAHLSEYPEHHVIDAMQSIEEVAKEVIQVLRV